MAAEISRRGTPSRYRREGDLANLGGRRAGRAGGGPRAPGRFGGSAGGRLARCLATAERDGSAGGHADQGDRAAGSHAGVSPGEPGRVDDHDWGGRGRGGGGRHWDGAARGLAVVAGDGVAAV